ncbi:MAG TPA: hypothetical protein VE085_03750 [Burkholderiales bacterium]|nr:hypothetical protein [Burkholderiales bacterium]
MATTDYPVPLRGPEAHRLADMVGVLDDLRAAAAAAVKLRTVDQSPLNDVVLEALQDSALIRYGRAFSTGVRTEFRIPPEWIDALPEDLRKAHDDLLDLRNAHIAHSVNDWEMNVPMARLRVDRDTGDAKVHAVSVNQSRVVLMAHRLSKALESVVELLAVRIERERKIQEARLLDIAKTIPVDEPKRLITDEDLGDDWPRPDKLGQRRPRE